MPLPPQPDRDCTPTPTPADPPLAEGPRLMVTEVVPVWQRHVEASRVAVESGIGDLLDSFSRLCDGVMAASRGRIAAVSHGEVPPASVELKARQEDVLAGLVHAVDVTHQRREQLLAQLAESLVQVDAIEAGLRASLPVDADAALQHLEEGRSALAALSRQVAADTRSDHARQDQALAEARNALVALAMERAEPEMAACALQSLSARIEKDLERVLLGMQFQDRLNQTLSNVASDMQRFTEWMRCNEHASHADAMRWLADLERSYTMQEQRARHHGLPDSPSQGGSVEFF